MDDVAKHRNPYYDGPKTYLVRSPKFAASDVKKSDKDEKSPMHQLKNKDFTPHRTDMDGNLTMDDEVTIEDAEQWALDIALRLEQELKEEKYCHLDLDEDSFFKKGSEVRKVYSFRPLKSSMSKAKKQKLRRKTRKEAKDKDRILITFSDPSAFVGARKYILDSGASFHLVDNETLTKEEQATIEKCASITSETANGEVVVNRRCLIYVKELNLYVWAFLHKDTVCVLSLGLLVDRAGFTFVWKPGQAPTLVKRKIQVYLAAELQCPFHLCVKVSRSSQSLSCKGRTCCFAEFSLQRCPCF